jgi:oxalate decarboxylase
MFDPQRREFLAAAGIASLAALGSAASAAGGDFSFMKNVTDPTLAGKDLPTFKFASEKSDGKVIGNSYGKEATVTQLPICKGIAGVSMRLETGAMRELPWHAQRPNGHSFSRAASAPPSSSPAASPRLTISTRATSRPVHSGQR